MMITPLSAEKEVVAKIDGKDWVGAGSYLVTFGNNPQLFSVTRPK
jgi:hypothetical protein